ncbi:hypothetical protein Tco_0855334 [Tanacetum coccineum]
MNPLVALDDALVALDDRGVIGKCNMRIDTTKTQKEATYQVVLDTLKLSPCYNAFLITADVPEIYMHQLWFTISKIKDTSSYQFKLDKKKFKVGVEVFRKVLQICPRLPNQEFIEPPSHEEIVTFIKELGYRGQLESINKLYIDHMSQPWRTLASITNKCLSRKTTDFMYQIDNRQTIVARRSSMPYPRFTKVIIQHFISKDKTISMRNNLFMHGIKSDSVLGRLKFVSKYEHSHVYGKPIPDVMLSKEFMETKAYKTYLAFATGNAIPKKARKRTTAHITPMKESSLITDDNIILDDPDVALELAKSISRTEAEEQEAARLVYETHERLVTEQSTRRRRQTGVTIRDTLVVSTKKTPTQSLKLKGIEMLSDAAMLAADTTKAIKARKRDLRSQHQTGGSSEGAGSKPEVPDDPKGKSRDTSEGAGSKPEVPDVSKAKLSYQESKNKSWGDSEDDDDDCKSDVERTESDDDKIINLNKTDNEEESQGDGFVLTHVDYVPTDDET